MATPKRRSRTVWWALCWAMGGTSEFCNEPPRSYPYLAMTEARTHLRGPYLRLPDERPRLRAADRAVGGRGLRRRTHGRAGRRGRVQHLCRAGERRQQAYGNLGHLAPVKTKRPACRSPSVAAWRRRTGQIIEKAPWVDVVFGTHNIGSLPVLLERARVQEEAQVEILESLEVFPSTLPTKRESAYAAWVSISVGCNNTCTFCIVPALRGKEKDRRPGDDPRRDRGAGGRGCLRGDAARAERERLRRRVRRPPGVLEAAAGLRRHRGAGAVPVHLPPPCRVHRRRDRGDGRDPQRDAVAAHAAAVGFRPGAEGHAPVLPAVEVPRHHRAGPRRHARRRDHHRHHRGLPGRDRGGLRGHADVVRRARFSGAFTFQYSKRPGTPAAVLEIRCRAPSSRSATSGSSSSSTRSPGRRTRRSWAAPSS